VHEPHHHDKVADLGGVQKVVTVVKICWHRREHNLPIWEKSVPSFTLHEMWTVQWYSLYKEAGDA